MLSTLFGVIWCYESEIFPEATLLRIHFILYFAVQFKPLHWNLKNDINSITAQSFCQLLNKKKKQTTTLPVKLLYLFSEHCTVISVILVCHAAYISLPFCTCEPLTRWPWSHSARLSAVESGIWQRRLSLSSVSINSRTLRRSSKRWSARRLPMKGEVGDWQSNIPFE